MGTATDLWRHHTVHGGTGLALELALGLPDATLRQVARAVCTLLRNTPRSVFHLTW